MQRRLAERPQGISVSPFWEETLLVQKATLAILAGKYRPAEILLDQENPGAGILIAKARLELFRGRPATAWDLLDRAAGSPTTENNETEMALLRAVLNHQQGRVEEAREAVENYLKLIPTTLHRRELGAIPHGVLEGLAQAVQVRDFSELLAAFPGECRVQVRPPLTPAETEVVKHFASTLRMPEIANALFISENTLASHRKRIYAKLGVTNRDGAVSAAWNLGLTESPREHWCGSAWVCSSFTSSPLPSCTGGRKRPRRKAGLAT